MSADRIGSIRTGAMEDNTSNGTPKHSSDHGEKTWHQTHVSWLTEAAEASRPRSAKRQAELDTDDLALWQDSQLSGHSQKMHTLWTQLTPKQQSVAKARLARVNETETLETIGERLDLTRERVRQIQVRITQKIGEFLAPETKEILDELEDQIGDLVSEDDFQSKLEQILGGCAENWDVAYMAYLVQASGYKLKRGIRISAPAVEFLKAARAHVPDSKEARIVDVGPIREMDPEYWYKYRSLIVQCLGLTLLPNGSVATRDTLPMRVLDALSYLGSPATKEELAELTGIPEKTLLSRLWCIDEIVKVANNLWTLKSPGLTKYVGVVDMIEQILQEEGGECSTEYLREEVRKRCNVKSSSVNTFLATSQFIVQNGRARLRRENEISLKPLWQTIDGRLANGSPYWTFTVQERHLMGNSVTGFPPELAHELGIEPNSYAWVPVNRPVGCRDLKVTWRMASANGVHIGYLRDTFEGLNCSVGQVLRLIVRHRRIEIQRHV